MFVSFSIYIWVSFDFYTKQIILQMLDLLVNFSNFQLSFFVFKYIHFNSIHPRKVKKEDYMPAVFDQLFETVCCFFIEFRKAKTQTKSKTESVWLVFFRSINSFKYGSITISFAFNLALIRVNLLVFLRCVWFLFVILSVEFNF